MCLLKIAWRRLLSTMTIHLQHFLMDCQVSQKVGLGPVHHHGSCVKLSTSTFSFSLTPVDDPSVTAWLTVLELTCREVHGHDRPKVKQARVGFLLSVLLSNHDSVKWRWSPATLLHPIVQANFLSIPSAFSSSHKFCTCCHRCCSLCPSHIPHRFQNAKYFLFLQPCNPYFGVHKWMWTCNSFLSHWIYVLQTAKK